MEKLSRNQLDEICDFADFPHSELTTITDILSWDAIMHVCLMCFSLNHPYTEKTYYAYHIQEIEKAIISLNKENVLKSIHAYVEWYNEQK